MTPADGRPRGGRSGGPRGDRGDARRTTEWALIGAAIAMLIVWAVWTFIINDAPGGVHVLLTLGVFILIWRIVALGTPTPKD